MLLEILEQPDDSQEAVELMLIEAWKTGDATALASFLLPPAAPENVEAYDEFYETIIFARNEVMADGIIELLEEGDDDDIYFVVVGAGHLIGENTVQSLLREEGYEANRASH
jgi:hypothetical protein